MEQKPAKARAQSRMYGGASAESIGRNRGQAAAWSSPSIALRPAPISR